jgi:ABC-2 type transport system permease protein
MRFLPLLVRPKILSFCNRMKRREVDRTERYRDWVILGFALFLMGVIFYATKWSLSQFSSTPQLSVLPASIPLSVVLLLLFCMVSLTNLVGALSALYLSEDLDLVLAAPIGKFRLFWGKFWFVTLTSAWMPFVFLLPFLLGFASHYNVSLEFFFVATAVLIPYFLIPTGLGIILATLCSFLLPTSRTRIMRSLIAVGFLGVVAILLDLLRRTVLSHDTSAEVLRIIILLGAPITPRLPSAWAANCLQQVITPGDESALPDFVLLYSVLFATASAAYLFLDLFHRRAFSNAKNNRVGTQTTSTFFQRTSGLVGALFPSYSRAIITKEFRVLSRDITALLELGVLLGLCSIYIYNLRSFTVLANIPDASREWWRSLFFILNAIMNTFVATAMCTRFVFPSISREGRSYWIVRTSPLQIREVMEAKFACWYVPVAGLTTLFFVFGGYALQVSFFTILLTAFVGWIVSYGIVRSAIGFGGIFARFDWEHPSELAAGFGSFVFMLYATILIFMSMIPAAIILFLPPTKILDPEAPFFLYFLFYAILVLLIVVLNIYACRWAFERGRMALEVDKHE